VTDLRVIGIDPGPIPGLVMLDLNDNHQGPGRWLGDVQVLQCSAGLLVELLRELLTAHRDPVLLQVERYVVGRRSARSSSAAAGATTRDMVGAICSTALGTDARVLQRSAAAVKPWATDERLERAGLLEACKGMRHARDAARHALFAACQDGHLPDPLSKEFRR
jgi:hypothetical protein